MTSIETMTSDADETTADKKKGKARKAKREKASASPAAPGGGKKKKGKATGKKPARTAAPGASYSNVPPEGSWPVGTMVKVMDTGKARNTWLKRGAVGRVFGYRPGKTGGALYAVRFPDNHSTLLSAKRVEKVKA